KQDHVTQPAVHQLAGDAGERGVAFAVANWLGQHRVPVFKRLADFAVCLGRFNLGDQPVRSRGEVLSTVNRPRILSAAMVNRWLCDHVSAVASDIEPSAELAGAVADLALAGSEVAVPALAGDDFGGGWQGAVLTFKLAQGGFAVVTIDIEHEDAA